MAVRYIDTLITKFVFEGDTRPIDNIQGKLNKTITIAERASRRLRLFSAGAAASSAGFLTKFSGDQKALATTAARTGKSFDELSKKYDHLIDRLSAKYNLPDDIVYRGLEKAISGLPKDLKNFDNTVKDVLTESAKAAGAMVGEMHDIVSAATTLKAVFKDMPTKRTIDIAVKAAVTGEGETAQYSEALKRLAGVGKAHFLDDAQLAGFLATSAATAPSVTEAATWVSGFLTWVSKEQKQATDELASFNIESISREGLHKQFRAGKGHDAVSDLVGLLKVGDRAILASDTFRALIKQEGSLGKAASKMVATYGEENFGKDRLSILGKLFRRRQAARFISTIDPDTLRHNIENETGKSTGAAQFARDQFEGKTFDALGQMTKELDAFTDKIGETINIFFNPIAIALRNSVNWLNRVNDASGEWLTKILGVSFALASILLPAWGILKVFLLIRAVLATIAFASIITGGPSTSVFGALTHFVRAFAGFASKAHGAIGIMKLMSLYPLMASKNMFNWAKAIFATNGRLLTLIPSAWRLKRAADSLGIAASMTMARWGRMGKVITSTMKGVLIASKFVASGIATATIASVGGVMAVLRAVIAGIAKMRILARAYVLYWLASGTGLQSVTGAALLFNRELRRGVAWIGRLGKAITLLRVSSLVVGFKGVGTALAGVLALMGPWGWAALAIGAALAAIVYYWKDIAEWAKRAGEWISKALGLGNDKVRLGEYYKEAKRLRDHDLISEQEYQRKLRDMRLKLHAPGQYAMEQGARRRQEASGSGGPVASGGGRSTIMEWLFPSDTKDVKSASIIGGLSGIGKLIKTGIAKFTKRSLDDLVDTAGQSDNANVIDLASRRKAKSIDTEYGDTSAYTSEIEEFDKLFNTYKPKPESSSFDAVRNIKEKIDTFDEKIVDLGVYKKAKSFDASESSFKNLSYGKTVRRADELEGAIEESTRLANEIGNTIKSLEAMKDDIGLLPKFKSLRKKFANQDSSGGGIAKFIKDGIAKFTKRSLDDVIDTTGKSDNIVDINSRRAVKSFDTLDDAFKNLSYGTKIRIDDAAKAGEDLLKSSSGGKGIDDIFDSPEFKKLASQFSDNDFSDRADKTYDLFTEYLGKNFTKEFRQKLFKYVNTRGDGEIDQLANKRFLHDVFPNESGASKSQHSSTIREIGNRLDNIWGKLVVGGGVGAGLVSNMLFGDSEAEAGVIGSISKATKGLVKKTTGTKQVPGDTLFAQAKQGMNLEGLTNIQLRKIEEVFNQEGLEGASGLSELYRESHKKYTDFWKKYSQETRKIVHITDRNQLAVTNAKKSASKRMVDETDKEPLGLSGYTGSWKRDKPRLLNRILKNKVDYSNMKGSKEAANESSMYTLINDDLTHGGSLRKFTKRAIKDTMRAYRPLGYDVELYRGIGAKIDAEIGDIVQLNKDGALTSTTTNIERAKNYLFGTMGENSSFGTMFNIKTKANQRAAYTSKEEQYVFGPRQKARVLSKNEVSVPGIEKGYTSYVVELVQSSTAKALAAIFGSGAIFSSMFGPSEAEAGVFSGIQKIGKAAKNLKGKPNDLYPDMPGKMVGHAETDVELALEQVGDLAKKIGAGFAEAGKDGSRILGDVLLEAYAPGQYINIAMKRMHTAMKAGDLKAASHASRQLGSFFNRNAITGAGLNLGRLFKKSGKELTGEKGAKLAEDLLPLMEEQLYRRGKKVGKTQFIDPDRMFNTRSGKVFKRGGDTFGAETLSGRFKASINTFKDMQAIRRGQDIVRDSSAWFKSTGIKETAAEAAKSTAKAAQDAAKRMLPKAVVGTAGAGIASKMLFEDNEAEAGIIGRIGDFASKVIRRKNIRKLGSQSNELNDIVVQKVQNSIKEIEEMFPSVINDPEIKALLDELRNRVKDQSAIDVGKKAVVGTAGAGLISQMLFGGGEAEAGVMGSLGKVGKAVSSVADTAKTGLSKTVRVIADDLDKAFVTKEAKLNRNLLKMHKAIDEGDLRQASHTARDIRSSGQTTGKLALDKFLIDFQMNSSKIGLDKGRGGPEFFDTAKSRIHELLYRRGVDTGGDIIVDPATNIGNILHSPGGDAFGSSTRMGAFKKIYNIVGETGRKLKEQRNKVDIKGLLPKAIAGGASAGLIGQMLWGGAGDAEAGIFGAGKSLKKLDRIIGKQYLNSARENINNANNDLMAGKISAGKAERIISKNQQLLENARDASKQKEGLIADFSDKSGIDLSGIFSKDKASKHFQLASGLKGPSSNFDRSQFDAVQTWYRNWQVQYEAVETAMKAEAAKSGIDVKAVGGALIGGTTKAGGAIASGASKAGSILGGGVESVYKALKSKITKVIIGTVGAGLLTDMVFGRGEAEAGIAKSIGKVLGGAMKESGLNKWKSMFYWVPYLDSLGLKRIVGNLGLGGLAGALKSIGVESIIGKKGLSYMMYGLRYIGASSVIGAYGMKAIGWGIKKLNIESFIGAKWMERFSNSVKRFGIRNTIVGGGLVYVERGLKKLGLEGMLGEERFSKFMRSLRKIGIGLISFTGVMAFFGNMNEAAASGMSSAWDKTASGVGNAAAWVGGIITGAMAFMQTHGIDSMMEASDMVVGGFRGMFTQIGFYISRAVGYVQLFGVYLSSLSIYARPIIGFFRSMAAYIPHLLLLGGIWLSLTPPGWVLWAIAGVAAGVATVIYYWDKLKSYFPTFSDIGAAWEGIKGKVSGAVDAFWNWIGVNTTEQDTSTINKMGEAWDGLSGKIGGAVTKFREWAGLNSEGFTSHTPGLDAAIRASKESGNYKESGFLDYFTGFFSTPGPVAGLTTPLVPGPSPSQFPSFGEGQAKQYVMNIGDIIVNAGPGADGEEIAQGVGKVLRSEFDQLVQAGDDGYRR